MPIWLQILLAIIWGGIIICIFFYIILGGKFIFFNSVPVNSTRFIYEGSALYKTLVNVAKDVVGEKIVKASSKNTFFGYTFLSFSPTIRVASFPLKTQVTYTTQSDGSTKVEWSVKKDAEGKEILLQHLRNEIEFVFDFYDIEGGGAGDAFRANLKSVTCTFFALDPERVALKSGGNSLVVAYNHLLSHVGKIVAPIATYNELKGMHRSGADSIFNGMLNPDTKNTSVFNKELFVASGFILQSIAGGEISTNRALEIATEKKNIATLEGEAILVTAEFEKQADKKKAEGKAYYTAEELKALKNSKAKTLDKIIVGAEKVFGKK